MLSRYLNMSRDIYDVLTHCFNPLLQDVSTEISVLINRYKSDFEFYLIIICIILNFEMQFRE